MLLLLDKTSCQRAVLGRPGALHKNWAHKTRQDRVGPDSSFGDRLKWQLKLGDVATNEIRGRGTRGTQKPILSQLCLLLFSPSSSVQASSLLCGHGAPCAPMPQSMTSGSPWSSERRQGKCHDGMRGEVYGKRGPVLGYSS